ncbi:cytospin-A-like isoform X3 [Clavelina lepadiformis]|uniref:cytospin-A-like isoform X3 n=1 Tax=Clavelina lepadiformis TaxID=159417 RepID=UPI0040410BAD
MFKRCFSPKIISAGSGSTTAHARRPLSSKESQKHEKARDKSKPVSGKANSASASSSGRSSSLLSKRTKDASKPKTDTEKTSLETKIKDLMALAKNKDSEIKSLKTKLDHMMHLLNKQHQEEDEEISSANGSSPKGDFASLVKLSDGAASRDRDHDHDEDAAVIDMQQQLRKLQEENMKLREQVDVMMLSIKAKDADKSVFAFSKNRQDLETLSNDDGLSSSLDDIASTTSGDMLQSGSVSRATSTENLLDDVSTSGTTSSNGPSGVRGDDKIPEDCISEASSVTVACLTERIHRMEESQISTHEELEATVQELTDLQKSVPELTIDNDRLQHEKEYLVKELSVAEKKLADQVAEAKHLNALLSDHMTDGSKHSDLKQQYLVLLNERKQLLHIQESMNKDLQDAANEKKGTQELTEAFQERMRHLERELTQSNTEKSLLNKKLKEAKDSADEQKELSKKYEGELQNERHRLELMYSKQEVSQENVDFIESLKKENKDLKEKCLRLEEDHKECQLENEKLDARVAELEEDQEAYNAKTKKDLSELSEVIDRLQEDIRIKQVNLDEANETLFVMEDSVEQHIAIKKHDNHTIQRLQNQISDLREERFRLEKEIQQLKKEQRNQSEEWKQFQADLQMAVMIANDMKAETQAEVGRLRDENQVLDEAVTKLRVENEQLRRKRLSSVSATSASILEAVSLRQAASRSSVDISALRESYKRRASENSPGVQSLIKSFDNQNAEPSSPVSPHRSQSIIATDSAPFSPEKKQTGTSNGARTDTSPITATVNPLPRHHSMSSITPSPTQTTSNPSIVSKLQSNSNAGSTVNSKPGTPDGTNNNVSPGDLQQLSSLLRRNSEKPDTRKAVSDTRDIIDRFGPSSKVERRGTVPSTTTSTPAKPQRSLSISTPGDPLASLARRYGGSKRNALLKWCQEKTRNYHGVDITNFSSSWSDGLALCGLLHSYLPAHIPYESLQQTYMAAADEKARNQLQAKNFRLAFAAAESVGIDPTLTTDEMTTKERPDWQRVMTYVTQIYKYFET